MSISKIASQIRDMRINKHVEIMLLGDPAKLLLLPLWAQSTIIPEVYQAVYPEYRCNIWNCASMASASASASALTMFHMDGTVNTGFDYCIVVYDTITRLQAESLDKWISIKDQICVRQHPDRKCEMVVIVLKTPRTPAAVYDHITQATAKLKVHMIPVDNTADGLNRIKTLVERLANVVYTKRKAVHAQTIEKLLRDIHA